MLEKVYNFSCFRNINKCHSHLKHGKNLYPSEGTVHTALWQQPFNILFVPPYMVTELVEAHRLLEGREGSKMRIRHTSDPGWHEAVYVGQQPQDTTYTFVWRGESPQEVKGTHALADNRFHAQDLEGTVQIMYHASMGNIGMSPLKLRSFIQDNAGLLKAWTQLYEKYDGMLRAQGL